MPQPTQSPPLTRRWWFPLLVLLPLLIALPPYLEAYRVEVTHTVVRIPGLPPAFAGLRLALLTDIHRGPFLSEQRVRHFVDLANQQHPDAIVLTGDYVHRSQRYIYPAWAEFAKLQAPLGVFAVLGNHDYWESGEMTVAAMANAQITNLTNRSVTLERDGQRLFIAGVDDLWAGQPDLKAALQGIGPNEVGVLLCHNPDYIEQANDPRARLWLSGHTHGGQFCLRKNRPLVHPSGCGLRYLAGLRRHGQTQIYISRGLGTVTPPLRWNCRAELPVIELQP